MQQKEKYTARINRVIDYIGQNLNKKLDLETLAKVAHFSPFHFHRIFAAATNETLNSFIKRLRVEKAAMQICYNSNESITSIALRNGFSSSQIFARAFRDFFDMSPTDLRKKCNTDSKKEQEFDLASLYNRDKGRKNNSNDLINLKMKIEVKNMPALNVAYIRHIGPYKADADLFGSLFGRLMQWAGPRDLFDPKTTQFLSVYYDDPEITDQNKLRMDVCMTVPEGTKTEGKIGSMTIEQGKCAVARFELATDEFEQAWKQVFKEWLPQSGYQPDDRPCYELYHNDYREHPQKKHIVDICVPVKPL